MPRDVFDADYPSLRASERLSFDQMEKVAGAFSSLGVEKICITGGEPLLRRGLESLIEQLARLTTVSGKPTGIAMTTNGSLVAARARALRDAGLGRVTVNLDAVDDALFRRMSDVALSVSRILDGIEQACLRGRTRPGQGECSNRARRQRQRDSAARAPSGIGMSLCA
ncbi:molybdenum cofactor biosynthesis enzyme MoaA [Paraburkholderia sp. UCT70]|uniref:radical SAM protein n=1 Tax=Paraburkholderia sp. UCT70 TaxID=2991068 RepID=UPI003D207768